MKKTFPSQADLDTEEARIQAYEDQGMDRSDAQGAVMAEDMQRAKTSQVRKYLGSTPTYKMLRQNCEYAGCSSDFLDQIETMLKGFTMKEVRAYILGLQMMCEATNTSYPEWSNQGKFIAFCQQF